MGDDEETFEHFKVYAAFTLGMYVFTTIVNRFDERKDQILFLSLEIIRSECDRYGRPELIPLTSASKSFLQRRLQSIFSSSIVFFFISRLQVLV